MGAQRKIAATQETGAGRPRKSVATQSLADLAKEQIRDAIFEGKIKPEERLIIERIAADIGSSRTPVREALKALEADGIVRLLPNSSAVVRRFDREEIHDRYSVRALLDGYAAELACRARGAELAFELERDCVLLEEKLSHFRVEDLQDAADLLRLSIHFRTRIRESSGSATIARILESLQMPVAYRLYYRRDKQLLDSLLVFYRELVELFRAGKAKQVRRLMERHLFEVRDHLIATLGGGAG